MKLISSFLITLFINTGILHASQQKEQDHVVPQFNRKKTVTYYDSDEDQEVPESKEIQELRKKNTSKKRATTTQ